LVDTVVDVPTLADRIRDGDSTAEDEFVACFYGRVLLMARVRLRDDQAALDLAQEAVFGALRGLREGRLNNHDQLSSYVYGTARNLINNHFRRSDPPSSAVTDRLPGPDRTELLALETERREQVRHALEGLNPVDRAILGMTLLEGMKPGEIASRLDMKPEVVRKRKSRAVSKVKDVIERTSRIPSAGNMTGEEGR
jgi:RNA polymerase sigma-70 factor (ECF subfamily)